MTENIYKFVRKQDDGVLLNIHLTPNSSKNEIAGYTEDYLKIKVSAPPNDNKANKKLIEFLSDTFDIAKSYITFVSGEKSRIKKFLIKNINYDDVLKKIFVYDKINS